jgi:hypothetical protein
MPGDEGEDSDDDYFPPGSAQTAIVPRANWRGLGKLTSSKSKRQANAGGSVNSGGSGTVNRFTRRSRMRSIKKHLREPPSIQKMRVSAYCTCEQLQLFKLLKWLERIETGQLPGGELNPDGWSHKMYMGAIHSTCAPPSDDKYVSACTFYQNVSGRTSNRLFSYSSDEEAIVPIWYRQKDVFYFGYVGGNLGSPLGFSQELQTKRV